MVCQGRQLVIGIVDCQLWRNAAEDRYLHPPWSYHGNCFARMLRACFEVQHASNLKASVAILSTAKFTQQNHESPGDSATRISVAWLNNEGQADVPLISQMKTAA